MNWNWKKDFRKNALKILAHQLIEYSVLGSVYIALEGDPIFWPVGITIAVVIHIIVFTKIDFLHQLHHHHKNNKEGHTHHTQDFSHEL